MAYDVTKPEWVKSLMWYGSIVGQDEKYIEINHRVIVLKCLTVATKAEFFFGMWEGLVTVIGVNINLQNINSLY